MQLPTAPTKSPRPHHRLRRIRPFYAAAALIGIGILLLAAPLPVFVVAVPLGLAGFLTLQLLIERARRKNSVRDLNEIRDSKAELARQIAINTRNFELVREISGFLSSKTRTDEVVASIVYIMEKKLDFRRGLVLLVDEQRRHLKIRGAYGCGVEERETLRKASFRLNNPKSRNPFVVSFRRKKPVLVGDVGEILQELTPTSQSYIRALGIESFIACPIVLEGKVVGVLGVDNRIGGRPLLPGDLDLLLGIAPVIAISIHNAQLLDARQAQFESTLHVLAESIDARDFLTAGHSRKVAEYAEGIALEMGLPDEFRRMLRTAALLHDYGKIAIPDAILKKEGPLTDEERAIINTHPARTKQILEKIAFDGIYRQIPSVVLAHHERWDGAGYPNALRGEEIPLAARIIAVADYYEAITAKRHYREPMLLQEALDVLTSESEGHFDPRVLQAFFRYLHLKQTPVRIMREKEQMLRVMRTAYRTEISAKVDRRIFAGYSVDISCGGLFFATEDVCDVLPDTEVFVTFELPQQKRLAQVRGRVAWVNSGYPRPAERLPEGFGVIFAELPEDVLQSIERFMEEMIDSPLPQTMAS